MKQQLLNSLFLWVCLSLFISCGHDPQKRESKKYLRHVGDIPYDATLDSENFHPCHEDLTAQYYNSGNPIQYKGEKPALEEAFLNQYQFDDSKDESGFITIRFLVNCQGETGRFRVEEMDTSYQPKIFSKRITEQLLAITISLDGWQIIEKNNIAFDYYQYLTFKLENGQIKEILP